MANDILGPWTVMGDPLSGPDSEITFYGQSTFVLPVAGRKDAYIAMFDRWNKFDLHDSRYIWLPVTIRPDGTIDIPWRESWTIREAFPK